jgi:hypothetical protein
VCIVGSLENGALGAIDEEALRICDEDKHPFGRFADVEDSLSISSRERGTTSQAFYRNGAKWRLEDQRGNCEEPVRGLLKPRSSMRILLGRRGVKAIGDLAHLMTKVAEMALKRGVRPGQAGNAVKLPIVGHAPKNVYARNHTLPRGARVE